ncbi:MAG: hypothetical protein M3P18_25370, partial [Actinomycetota bacterium]|nr:hypothetical protein [Actinomycetota bacterium]
MFKFLFPGPGFPSAGVALQGRKIVLAGLIDLNSNGSDQAFALARVLPRGGLDTTFNGKGRVVTDLSHGQDGAIGLAIQGDGKIILAGYSIPKSGVRGAIVRYTFDGSLDPKFNSTGIKRTATDGEW